MFLYFSMFWSGCDWPCHCVKIFLFFYVKKIFSTLIIHPFPCCVCYGIGRRWNKRWQKLKYDWFGKNTRRLSNGNIKNEYPSALFLLKRNIISHILSLKLAIITFLIVRKWCQYPNTLYRRDVINIRINKCGERNIQESCVSCISWLLIPLWLICDYD